LYDFIQNFLVLVKKLKEISIIFSITHDILLNNKKLVELSSTTIWKAVMQLTSTSLLMIWHSYFLPLRVVSFSLCLEFKNSLIIHKGNTRRNECLMSVFKFDKDTAKFCSRFSPENNTQGQMRK